MKFLIPLIFIIQIVYGINDGDWVYWDQFQDGVPPNAVLGGSDEGGPLYVARARHFNEGYYMGVIPGKYSLSFKRAYIPFYGKEYERSVFEVRRESI